MVTLVTKVTKVTEVSINTLIFNYYIFIFCSIYFTYNKKIILFFKLYDKYIQNYI